MAKLQIPQSKINTLQIEAQKNNIFYESMINLPNEEIVTIAQGPIDEHLNSTDPNHSCVLCHNILVGSESFTSSETGA
jgi:hypothetical protein